MEVKRCKNKKCQRPLPEGFKYKHCENCRNKHVKLVKDGGKTLLSFAGLIGVSALTMKTRGKINHIK